MNGEKEIQKAYKSILDHDFEQAIEHFEQAIAKEPDNAAYHYKLSITYARSHKLDKAIEAAERACELDPKLDDYRFHLQNLQAKQLISQAEAFFDDSVQLHMAITLLKQAIELDPLAVDAYLLMGMAYHGLGEYSRAIQSLHDALKLEPNHTIASKLLREVQQEFKAYFNP